MLLFWHSTRQNVVPRRVKRTRRLRWHPIADQCLQSTTALTGIAFYLFKVPDPPYQELRHTTRLPVARKSTLAKLDQHTQKNNNLNHDQDQTLKKKKHPPDTHLWTASLEGQLATHPCWMSSLSFATFLSSITARDKNTEQRKRLWHRPLVSSRSLVTAMNALWHKV